ncbi:MAG TPA: type II secretion system protein [Phycisphaerae bacterium]|nr:type II secretion system protein [Phycisphaerae bacterium]
MDARRMPVGFTLIELLVVVSVIAILLAILVPSLGAAKRSAQRARCLANLHGLELAQQMYAGAQDGALISPGDGSYGVQGSWIGMLQGYTGAPLIRRCPSDQSPYFTTADTDLSPAVYRVTSYGINNYVTPSHAPLGTVAPTKITQIANWSAVIQFVELAETGSYAVADHIHVDDFYFPLIPSSTLNRICGQMPVGRHGGGLNQWSGVLNYGFLDGHAESLALKDVYTDPNHNLFNPAVAH